MDEKRNPRYDSANNLKASEVFSEAHKKSILPMILLIMGISEIILHVVIFFSLIPMTHSFASTVGDKTINTWSYLPLGIIIGIFIAEVFFGVKLRRKQNHIGYLSVSQRNLAMVMLLLGIFAVVMTLIPMTIDFAIYYIYSAFSSTH